MATTLLDLPPELLFRILESIVSVYDIRLYCKPRDEYAHLRTTALVCKAWTTPSQILLWRYVSLRSKTQAQAWVNCPAAGRYTTWGLWMYGRVFDAGVRTWDSSLVRAVLGRTVGLQALEFLFFDPFPAECLTLPCLKDLTTLVVNDSSILTTGLLGLPFRLQVFKTEHSRMSPSVVRELFCRSADTLRCLDLSQQHAMDSPTLPVLYKSFPCVAAGIRTLRMTTAYAHLVPHLAECTRLSRLELPYEMTPELATEIIDLLPAPLEDLYMQAGLWSGGPRVLSHVVDALDCPSLSRLQRLHLREDLYSHPDLEYMCRIVTARKIAIVVAREFLPSPSISS
ncbi:hypothetical protein B0H11DRAFT_2216370 [Mycena galericulata]|nr:hypothetical protein B0H11DRAFT_2216370 [Mycena galericulata]